MSAAEMIDFERIREIIPGIAGVGDEPEGLPPAPTMPDVLPPAVGAYVRAAARSVGVSQEMVAIPIIAAAGATIGFRLHIVLKSGFRQYPTLFAGVVGDPGVAKTPAMMMALLPLTLLQEEHYEQFQREKLEFEGEMGRYDARLKGGETGAKPVKPELTHLFSSDPTMEALVRILQENQGVIVLRDELLSWITALNQYRGGNGSDRQQWLSLWSGAPIKKDRASAETIYVGTPVVGVYGGIQPDNVSRLHDEKGARDGFIERLLLFYPEVEPANWTEDDLDPALVAPVLNLFRTLRNVGSTDPKDQWGVNLSSGARRAWIDWYNENAQLIRATSGLRRGFYAKLPNQVARFALILNTLWTPDNPQLLVSEERMEDAIALGEFFRRHLDRVLPLFGDSSGGHAAGLPGRILRVLRKEASPENGGWIRRAVIIKRLNVKAEQLTEALESLESEFRIERRAVRTATRSAEEWRIVGPRSRRIDLQPGEVEFS